MTIQVGDVAKGLNAHEQVAFADLIVEVEQSFENKTMFIIIYALATLFAKQYEDQPLHKLEDFLADLSKASVTIHQYHR